MYFKVDYVTMACRLDKLQAITRREPHLFAEWLRTPRCKEFTPSGSARFIRAEWRGKDIAAIDPCEFMDILGMFHRAGGKCSRIDFCIDTSVAPDWMSLDAATLATSRTPHRWGNAESGFTVGAGNRSRRLVRVYDKKRQQALPESEPEWTRIELEVHRAQADALLALYLDLPASEQALDKELISLITKTMPSVASFLEIALDARIEPPTRATRKRKSSKEWLTENQERIVRAILDNPGFFNTILSYSTTTECLEFADCLGRWAVNNWGVVANGLELDAVWARSLIDISSTAEILAAVDDAHNRLSVLSRLVTDAIRFGLTDS